MNEMRPARAKTRRDNTMKILCVRFAIPNGWNARRSRAA